MMSDFRGDGGSEMTPSNQTLEGKNRVENTKSSICETSYNTALQAFFYCLGYLITRFHKFTMFFDPLKKSWNWRVNQKNTCCQGHDIVFIASVANKFSCTILMFSNILYRCFSDIRCLGCIVSRLVQFHQLSVSGALCALVCQSFTVNIFKKSVFITFFSFYKAYFQIFTI